MRILSAEQMRACDEATFRDLELPSRAVMEVAGRAVADAAIRLISPDLFQAGVLVLAGAGNNGGDGYVVARLLHQSGIPVTLVPTVASEQLRNDAKACCESFRLAGGVFSSLSEVLSRKHSPGVVIDGIFGTGFSRPADGEALLAIRAANELRSSGECHICAIDLPSGVEANTGKILGEAIVADTTISLQSLKPCHVLNPAHELCGDIYVAEIGVRIPESGLAGPVRSLLQGSGLKPFIQPLRASSSVHKGTRGHVLVIGGSPGKTGAPQLSARGALRAGCGLASVLIPGGNGEFPAEQFLEVMTSSIPESLSEEELRLLLLEQIQSKKALVIGPGLGTTPRARMILRLTLGILGEQKIPLVLDADALNILSMEADGRLALPPLCVITPHPGEMARLQQKTIPEIEGARLEQAEAAAKRLGVVTVLKGAMTVIATPDSGTFVSPHSHANLATAGSGDVLSGILAGYLAQGLDLVSATQLSVYLHAEAGAVLEAAGPGKGVGALAHEFADLQPEVAEALLAFEEERSGGFLRRCLPARLLSAGVAFE